MFQNRLIKIGAPFMRTQSRFASANAGLLNRAAVLERTINKMLPIMEGKNIEITEKSHFSRDLGLDSLDQVEIVIAVEDEFGISVEESEAEKLLTVKSLVEYVLKCPESK